MLTIHVLHKMISLFVIDLLLYPTIKVARLTNEQTNHQVEPSVQNTRNTQSHSYVAIFVS